ncbi:hypothetical protein AB6A40_002408 [Gnathostoma spinigerum]|uniref:Uncharacterized protein n=1 Tax=Gnathostoma spinigerum TaxID=75299 RepID=A0ABD6EC26_9BILA
MCSVESHQNVDPTVELAVALAIVTSRYQKTSDGKEPLSKRRKSDSPPLTIAEVLALNDWAAESHRSIALTEKISRTASIWITRLQILDTFKWSLVGNKLSSSEIEVGIRKRFALLSKALKYVKCPVDVPQLLEVYAIRLISLHPICYTKGINIVGKSLNKFIRSVLNRWLGSVEDFEEHDRAWLRTEALIIRVCRIPSDRSLLSGLLQTVGKFKTWGFLFPV